MKVLVTGASGFIGGYACAELAGRGHEVLALVRRPGSEPDGTTPVAGDLRDTEALIKALTAAAPEAVVHLAAETAATRSAKKIHDVNVLGTDRLLGACEHAGVRRFVFVSTVVQGDPHGEQIDEDTPLPVETAYGRSKAECERLVRESSLEDVILRPCHVYGTSGWFAEEFVARLRQPGRFAVIGKGDNWWDVVRVEDVCSAIADCVEKAAPGSLYHVVDDEPIRFYDFIALTAEELGTGPPRRLPAGLARLFAGSGPIDALTRSARNSNAKLKRELGWQPQYPTAREGVRDAVAQMA